MNSFEKLILSYLKPITDPLLDPLQFAYRANCSVDDAINLSLHHILRHLDQPSFYVRALFVDYSSAFNTILSDPLHTCYSNCYSYIYPAPSVRGSLTSSPTGSNKCGLAATCQPPSSPTPVLNKVVSSPPTCSPCTPMTASPATHPSSWSSLRMTPWSWA